MGAMAASRRRRCRSHHFSPSVMRKGVMTLHEWMEANLPPKVLGMIDWPRYRLFSMCWAQNCPVIGRANILHTPQQLWRCENTAMAVVLNEDRYAELVEVVPVSQASA
jgi:hypothetical protein